MTPHQKASEILSKLRAKNRVFAVFACDDVGNDRLVGLFETKRQADAQAVISRGLHQSTRVDGLVVHGMPGAP